MLDFNTFTVRQGVFKVMHCYTKSVDRYPQKSNVSSTNSSLLLPAGFKMEGGHETDGH